MQGSLSALAEDIKGLLGSRDIVVGDVVLIKENEPAPRTKWRIGKVIQLVTGQDGLVRGAKLKVLAKMESNLLFTDQYRNSLHLRSLKILLKIILVTNEDDQLEQERGG